jgi:hypothetical protein
MKHDEVLIQLRDDMKDAEVIEVLRKMSAIQHRVIAISIGAGARALQPYMQALFQATAHLENAILAGSGNVPPGTALVGVEGGVLRPQ